MVLLFVDWVGYERMDEMCFVIFKCGISVSEVLIFFVMSCVVVYIEDDVWENWFIVYLVLWIFKKLCWFWLYEIDVDWLGENGLIE